MRTRALLAPALGLLAWLAVASPAAAQVCAVPGTTGAASVTGIVNTYYPGSASVGAGSTSVPVGAKDGRGSGTDVAAGDLLLIIQIQDASISTSNTSGYGGSGTGQGYTTLNSSGLFEYAVAAGPASGGAIPLAAGLANSYSVGAANSLNGQKRFQVLRVPQYSSATVTGTVTAPPWDGSTGGIVAFDVAGQLNWNSQTIDVNGRGFRGGGGQCSIGSGGTWANTDYRTSSAGLTLGTAGVGTTPNGAKGEGVAGTPIIVFTPATPGSNAAGAITNTGGTDGTSGGYPAGSFGRGAPGNGGGGGTDGNPPANDQNTGGGGGGNFGIGGKGGYGWTPLTPPGFDTGGFGGMSVPSGASRLFFGGGGGSGTTNNCTGTPGSGAASSGAAGGGMVFVRAGTVAGSGTINARGTDGNSTILNDASGGGGAGGSALVYVNNGGGATGVSINVQGGNGGSNTGGGSPHGPGGGGSGGFAITSGAASFGVAGGANGTTATSATSTAEYGSSSSVGGFQITSLAASQIPGANSTSACFPQLTVVKTTSTPTASAGTTATYTIVASNAAGKQPATTVTISDPLPGNPNITYASTTSVALAGGATRTAVVNPAPGATTPSWGTFSIPGGASVTITFVVNLAAATPPATYQNPANVTYLDPTRTSTQTVTPGGTYTAGGTVGGSNYNPASATGEDVLVVNAPTIAKSFTPGAISVGSTGQLSVVVNNPGTVALANVGLVDTYPAGMVNAASPSATSSCGGTVAAAPSSGSLALTGGAIAAGGNCTITANITVTSAGPYVNTIPAGALTNTQGITNGLPGTATLYNNVTIAKSFAPNAVAPNSDSTLTFTLVNGNTVPMTLANPGFTDSLPAGLVATGGAVTATGCGTFSPATTVSNAASFTATGGTIAPNSTCTVAFAVRSAATGIYSNTSSGVTTTQANTTGPVSNTANLGVGLVNIAKQFAPSLIVSGGASTVTLTLTNPTGVAQTGGNFTDTLANMSVASNQAVGGTCTGVTPAALAAGQTAIAFTGINVPAGSCTITFTVTSSTVGTQTNVTSGVATAALPAGPASNTATLSVLAKPTIAKGFAPSTIAPNGVATLTFTISNAGPLPLTGMSFTDTYPATLQNATPLAVGGSCTGVTTTATAGGGTFNVTAGNIPASASCTITVQVTASAVASYPNTASGVATAETGTAGAGSNTATLFVAAAPTIAKSFATSPIAQGGTSLATFTLANPNTLALTNVNFTDVLSNMSVASTAIGGTCAGTTNAPALAVGATSLDLTVPALAAGASCTVTVTLTSSVSGTNPNTAGGATSTQTPAAGSPSNTANLVVLSPPTLQKNFSPGAIQSGGTTSIVFTLANPNAAALANVTFGDPLVNMALGAAPTVTETCTGAVTPAGVSAGSTSFSLTLNSLGAAETCTITVGPVTSSIASPAGGHPNTTSPVTSSQTPGGSPGATGYLNVLVAPAIAKQFSPNSVTGTATSTITFTLTNPNSVALTNVRFSDTFPANMRTVAVAQNFIGAGRGTCTGTIPSAQGAVNQTALTFSGTTLAPNSSCTIMVDVQVTANGVYTNTTSGVISNQTPTAGATASDVLTRGIVNVTKSFGAAAIEVGGATTLTFTLTNNSGASRSGLAFTDSFPAGMTAVGGAVTLATVSGTACSGLAPNTVTAGATAYNLTGLTIPNTSVCTVSLAVQAATSGVKSNTVTGTAPTQFAGSTDTATLTVYAAPAIAKAFSPATIAAGGTSTLTFTLTNPNAFAALTGAAFGDTLANMAVSGAQTVGGTCAGTTPNTLANGATSLAFTGITIPSGGSCTVTVVVSSGTVGVQPNASSGVTTAQTPTAGAGSGTVNLTVGGIGITKAFANASRPVGVATTLTFTLTSTQAVAWSGLAFTDTLPANLVVANPANAATTCGAAAVTAAPGTGVVALSGGAMAAGSGPCTVSVDVVSSLAGTYTNATANFGGLSTGASAAGASATVQYFPGATLAKAFSPATIAPGGATTLTFTLANPAGSPAATGLGFTDTLPANVVVAPAPAASNTCGATFAPAAGSSTLNLSGASLGAGAATCTAQVSVTSSVLGTYTNNAANVSGLAGGLSAASANASFSVVGTTLAKAFSPAVVGPNVASTLTFTITNGPGNPAQAGLAFTDTLPANLVVATPPAAVNGCGGTFAPAAGSGAVTLSAGALASAQASCTVSVNVTSPQVGTYVNGASNIGGEPAWLDASGVSATLQVLAGLSVGKAFAPATIPAGDPSVLTVTLTNANNVPVTGVAFSDAYAGAIVNAAAPAGASSCGGTVTAAAGASSLALSGGTVPANGSCTVTVNVTGNVPGAQANTIAAGAVASTNAGSNGAAATATLTVIARPTVAKAFGAASIASGAATTLTVTLSNANAVPITGVSFTDVFPVSPGAMTLANVTTANTCGGTLADSGGGGLNAGDAGIRLTGGTIPAGGSCTVSVNVTASASGTYTNTLAAGSVTSANASSNTAPASASLLVTAPATIAKAFAPATIAADAASTLTFTLANPNATALTSLRFTDALAGMTVGSAVIGGTCAGTANTPALAAGATALDLTVPSLAAGASCTITVTVTSDVPGAHDNQASGVSSAEAATGAASNIATLTVSAAPPTIAKAFAPATINADATSTITFTIANTNGVALTSAGFTDALTGMAISANGAAGGTCAGAPGNSFTAGQAALTLSNLTVPANGSCTVTVVVTSDTPGPHDNTASGVSSAQAPIGAVSNTATLTVNAAAPTISKAFAPSTIAAGATSTITFTLANTLGVPLTGGAFTDTLAGMAINAAGAAGGTCAGAAGNSFAAGATALAFTGLTVPANASCTVTVAVTSNVPGPHNNATSAFTSAQAPASAVSNTAVLTVTAVAPSIGKAFAPASIAADATSTITFTIANPLGVPLTSANFTDTLANMSVAATGAAGGTCAGSAGNFLTAGQTAVAITGLTIPASGSCTVTVVVSSDIPGTHPNQASGVASSEAPLGAPSNSANLTVTAAPATIAKAFGPAGIMVNATSTVTFTLSNANGIALTGAGFTDTLANMQVNANGPAGGTCAGAAGNTFTAGQTALAFTGLAIPINGSCTVTVVVLGNVIGAQPNQASGVSSVEAATGPASNVATLTVQPLPPTVSKQFAPASILSGGVTTLKVTIGNPNPSAITVTSVTDNYPGVVVTAGSPAQATTCAGGAVTFNATSATLTGGTVPANGSCTFQIDVTAPTQGLYTNTIPAGALTTSGGFNTLPASASLTVDPVADVSVVKNAPASIGTGQVLSYTVSVINNGPDAANGAQFADTVPAQIAGVGAVCGAPTGGAACGAVSVAGNAVTSAIASLPAGASVTFTISGTATGLGATTNTATVAAPGGVFDPAAGNNASSATTTILAPDLTLAKSHAGNFTVGVNGAYAIVVSNGAGSLSTAGVITVVDTLPAGLAFVSGAGTGWSCAAAGQTVTCTTSNAIAAGASAPAITITVAVSSTAVPSVLNVATVSGGGEPSAAANNNTASDNTIVAAAGSNAFAPDGAQTGMPGSVVFYPHTFNAGLAGSVAFATSSVPTPAVPGWSQTIYRDTNCNGALDGAEGAAPLAAAVPVNPGDAVCIIVRDSIPGAAPYNAQNVITVTATFNGSLAYPRTDTTTVGAAGGAGLTLAKTVRNVTQGGGAGTTGTALPNDVLEYTIAYTNTGSGTVSAIVVTDATPSFTLYQSAACGALPGNLTACSVTTQPAVNGTGSVVWTFTGSLLSGGSGSVSYQVRVSN